jgi:hypothetical protein
VCPTDALTFAVKLRDVPYQGPGHLGHAYRTSAQVQKTQPEAA